MSLAILPSLQAAGQDFEFYPTTNEIIAALVNDLKIVRGERYRRHFTSVLDIGAGNGKVLLALREAEPDLSELFAIEKSKLLCQQLPAHILIVGTEFEQQSLLTKQVDVVFSNPPYSEFEAWAERIIRQAASQVIYLVIPLRWQASTAIADALKFREATAFTVGEYDFENAEDRQARARVHLLRITLAEDKDDAFERFFEEQFAHVTARFTKDDESGEEIRDDARKNAFAQLVVGPTYPESLVSLYEDELRNIQRNYHLIGDLDAGLMREFDISPVRIRACLKARLAGLKNDYWLELFSHLSAITDRLTSSSRNRLLEVLRKHVHVDFTLSNIYAIILWVIKNTNGYINSQLIVTYERMVEKCNVILYKSNVRTWVNERWRYNSDTDPNTHYALDYRIVCHRSGGIRNEWRGQQLSDGAAEFLGDLLTLANNLGFRCSTVDHRLGHGRYDWRPNQLHTFYCREKDGTRVVLFDVRAFLNGNLHIRLKKEFILALNVEHGRLKGWLKNAKDAVEELKDPQAAKYFRANLQLYNTNAFLLLDAA